MKTKWSKTGAEYPMGSEVLTNSEQIGIPLEKNSSNCDILAQLATICKGGKEIRL